MPKPTDPTRYDDAGRCVSKAALRVLLDGEVTGTCRRGGAGFAAFGPCANRREGEQSILCGGVVRLPQGENRR